MKSRILSLIIILSMVILAGCGKQRDDNIKIAVTTSLLGCIVKELGREKVDVVTIVPS